MSLSTPIISLRPFPLRNLSPIRLSLPAKWQMFASSAPPSSAAPSTTSAPATNNNNSNNPNSNDQSGIFWSPAPPQPMQPTSILQRPPPPPPPGSSQGGGPPPPPPHLSQLSAPGNQQPPLPTGAGGVAEFAAGDYSQIFEWVSQLLKGPEGREKALLELSRKREQYDDLALILWHSFGIPSLLVLSCRGD